MLFDVVGRRADSANRLRSVLVKMFGWASTAPCSNNPMWASKNRHRKARAKPAPCATRNQAGSGRRWKRRRPRRGSSRRSSAYCCSASARRSRRHGRQRTYRPRHRPRRAWELPPGAHEGATAHVVPLPPFAREIVSARSRGSASQPRRSRNSCSRRNSPSARGWRGTVCRRRCGA